MKQTIGKSDEWYTPKYIFDSIGVEFDLDVASPRLKTYVPANSFIYENSLEKEWNGFIWCNPPFGGRNGIIPWADKFFLHGNGILLTPDRTSSKWWQECASKADAVLFTKGKVSFVKPDGTKGNQPQNGTTLFASGIKAVEGLKNAAKNSLGYFYLNEYV